MSHWSKENPSPESKAFLTLAGDSGPPKEQLLNFDAAMGYDAANLILEAIRRAGSTDRRAIRDALNAITNFRGVTGVISFNNTRDRSDRRSCRD